jgi:ADP-ribose pyrophosphatase YjhB (NUDIX family)
MPLAQDRAFYPFPALSDPRWLHWTRRLAAIAQNGLTYAEGAFDRERYQELAALAAEMMGAYTGTAPERVLQLFAREDGYATPKVDVRGVVFRAGEILLVREREDGRWSVPGGWADAGLTPREAIEKEVREESGFEVRSVRLLAVYDRERHDVPPLRWSVYKMFILCDLMGGDATSSIETEEVAFFPEHALPSLSEGRSSRKQIERMFTLSRNPNGPTDFD